MLFCSNGQAQTRPTAKGNAMSLKAELDAQRQRASEQRSPEERLVRARAVEAVADAEVAARAVGLGETMPRIELPDATGRMVDCGRLLDRGPLVVSFYRGGWCPYCNLELRGLQARLGDLRALGASIVAISPELPDRSLSTAQKNRLEFPVLSDRGN